MLVKLTADLLLEEGSISSTFYAQLLHQQSCASKVQTKNVSTKKLQAQLTYLKAAHGTLVKLTRGFFSVIFGETKSLMALAPSVSLREA
jgi:hypothetical protein